MSFYKLYYLLFHYGFEIEKLRSGQVRGAIFYLSFLAIYWLPSLIAIIGAEKDPVYSGVTIGRFLPIVFDPALLMSDNIVVIARKLAAGEDRPSS